MIRQRILSNLESMEELHRQHSWIPDSQSIRPDPDTIEKKKNYFDNMLNRYVTMQDFILHRFFGLNTETRGEWAQSKLYVSDLQVRKSLENSDGYLFRLVPNTFPYKVPTGTQHYVLWILLSDPSKNKDHLVPPLSDDQINHCIETALIQLLGHEKNNFSFVWYPNPKPTIISDLLFHVQVFWISS